MIVVVPTIREDKILHFRKVWDLLFRKHDVKLLIVHDGVRPYLEWATSNNTKHYTPKEIMGEYEDLIYTFNDGIRNLGFAFAKQFDDEIIVSLDDDVEPDGDTLQDHIDALQKKVPVSWISTASEYTRGFPYDVRNEAEVVLSHGVWKGVPDFDAPTQLVQGIHDISFYKGPIPKGILYPHCAMNFAFKRKLLPFIYQAPMGPTVGMDRFADIWMGIMCKREIDKKGWGVVSGYASVFHKRASNVYTNLVKEVKGLVMNEAFWKGTATDPYITLYGKQRKRWKDYVRS